MNLEKIGKFILEQRKVKKLTQAELAEKLGVTDKSIGNWENGRNLPDIILFEPLCDELGITINDLISGEKVDKEKYQQTLEKNMINTLDYTRIELNKKNNMIGSMLILLGIFISGIILTIPQEIIKNNAYLTIGWITTVFGFGTIIMGINELTKKFCYKKRILLIFIFFVLYFCVLFTINSLGILEFDFSFYI